MYRVKVKVLLGALFFLFILVGCGSGSSSGGDENTVVVGVYGGEWENNIREIALDPFEEETGIRVEAVAGSDAEWFTKLQAADGNNPPFDILPLTPDTIRRAVDNDLLLPLDPEYAPNLNELYPSIQEYFTIDGEVYSAGFSMGQLGIAYRRDLVPTVPESWLDLWNPEYKGYVAISSPSYSAGLQFLAAITELQGGNEANPEDVEKALDKIAELDENVSSYPDTAGTIQTLLERGEAWVVPNWDGRVFELEANGLDVGFVYPKEGPVASTASWSITKGSNNEENAYKLLDYLSSPEVQAKFSDLSFYGMSNKNVEYSDEIIDKVQVGEEAYQDIKWVNYDVVNEHLSDWTNQWIEKIGDQ